MPSGWSNPITAMPGQMQRGVDAAQLLPSRPDLLQSRLTQQRGLFQTQTPRWTPIQVTAGGVIWDGHHAVRIVAENGTTVDVLVVPGSIPPTGLTILQLPVR
jgi:hypothetical protein